MFKNPGHLVLIAAVAWNVSSALAETTTTLSQNKTATTSSAVLNRGTLDRQFETRMGHWRTAGVSDEKIAAARKLQEDAMAAMQSGDAKLGSKLQFDIPKLLTPEEQTKVRDAIVAARKKP